MGERKKTTGKEGRPARKGEGGGLVASRCVFGRLLGDQMEQEVAQPRPGGLHAGAPVTHEEDKSSLQKAPGFGEFSREL
jgi:hypothetical protein